jgi:mono/diheme cytochrome c family protein
MTPRMSAELSLTSRLKPLCSLALLLITPAAVGCSTAPMPEPSREARAEAAQIFATRCASCHGPLGKGDGPRGAKLSRRPRNFADPVWQLAISDRHLEKVILEGGASVGKSSEMPPNPDLAHKPEVMVALRQHLRVLAYTP